MVETNQQPDKFDNETWADLDAEIGHKKDPNETPDPGNETLDEIDDLISGKEHATEGSGEVEETTEPTKETEPEATDDESEDITEQPAAVDYSAEIEVPMPYGMEKMTVGELKDQVAEMHIKETRIEKDRNELMAERDRLIDLTNSIGAISPENRFG